MPSVFRMEPSTEYGRSVAHRVSAAIRAAGLTQREVSRATGIPLVTLNRRLQGHTPFIVTELYSIALATDVPVSSLYPEQVA